MFVFYIFGFLVEALGVATGFPFGNYQYGTILGFKLLQTPILIGVNWLILILCVSDFVSPLKRIGKTAIVITASICMVALDFLIEIVAIKYNWWNWYGEPVPVKNYIGWFLVSIAMFLVAFKYRLQIPQNLGRYILLIQLIFFALLAL